MMNALQTPFRVTLGDRADLSKIVLRAGDHFRMYSTGVRGNVTEGLTARMVDLLRLAQGVVVTDGLIARRERISAGFRSPSLEVEVIDQGFWNSPEVARALKACVDFLSGDDDWQIEFVPDRTTHHTHQRGLRFAEPTTVCLYSGGLDSAAGLASRIRTCPGRTFIPVVVRHQFLRGKIVKQQFDLLKKSNSVDSSRFLPFVVASFIRNRRLQREFGRRTCEPSHRCRSFLFTAVAGVVAAIERCDNVEIYESGIGAINLPLVDAAPGWRATRSTHPYFLRLVSQLVGLVAGRPIVFELPFVLQTKAELVAALVRNGLSELANSTVSCILHPYRRGSTQCGWCPACIYRRYALRMAGAAERPGDYRLDLFSSPASLRRVPHNQLRPLLAFLRQADRLAELDDEVRVPQFFRDHLLGTRIVAEEAALAPFVELFRRYRQEWFDLAARERIRQVPWAEWLKPANVAA